MDESTSETACARASSPITAAEGAGNLVIAARSKDSTSGSEIVQRGSTETACARANGLVTAAADSASHWIIAELLGCGP